MSEATQAQAYTIYDSKADRWHLPYFSTNHATAIREFARRLTENGTMNEFGEDFSLFYSGHFDQETGLIVGNKTPMHISNGNQLQNQAEPTLEEIAS